MDLDQLAAFVAVADCGTITAAATRLHRSQSAISRRVTLLEAELGAPLFDRLGTSLSLTEVGREFQPFAQQALGAVASGREAAHARQASTFGPVTIAIVGTLVEANVARVLGRLGQGPARLRVLTANSSEVSRLVLRGEAQFGIRYFNDGSPELTSETIASERMCVVKAGRGEVAPRWLGFPASRTIKEDFGRLLEQRLAVAGLAHAEVMHVDSLSAQKRLAEHGLGMALLPKSSVSEELKRGTLALARVPRVGIAIAVVMISRKGAYLSRATRHAMEVMRGAFA